MVADFLTVPKEQKRYCIFYYTMFRKCLYTFLMNIL